ncbi:S-adenosyl-L-methionine-dependent methyltransferase [Xylaria bambusicola]|uniref:S-adenosyl-L-methionine-dependent methyltransferase n=1 Tax=Xylaria bambusicola TaxID=326684 RepID=UPI002007552E|nr:S-adenosyl-L-methionine-dependent methyltransferase [Xylaria bambusicola]KAI0517861.1 S-adenosyl-L-methionine-dependent methyltransferase [Xylaria bambusicola]
MAEPKPEINPNPRLQSYYASLESVLGYDLLLGGTRHFGYYDDPKSYNPFPISRSLRRMEEQLFQTLRVRASARVLDAGCGNGHVARYMAGKELNVTAIDVVERHVRKAKKTARKLAATKKAKGSIEVRHMDYHHLDTLDSAAFDGVYTMETLVHATDPAKVLAGFLRVLKPGGRLAMHEYDNVLEEVEADAAENGGDKKTPNTRLRRAMRQVNEWSAMPTNAVSSPGAFKRMLEDAGFEEVQVRDLSDHIRPMTRFFYVLAIVPFLLISLLGLERYFINTVAGVGAYRGYGFWRYVQIEARKPGEGALVEET